MVVVDRLSKSAHFLPLKHPFTAKSVAEKFVEAIIKLHGMPKSIVSDRDSVFVSHFWQEFFKMSGTKLQLSSAYHLQTDGQTEVVNRCIEQYLRCLVHQWPKKWSFYLPWAEYWYIPHTISQPE
jgi:transposase InsO family protein